MRKGRGRETCSVSTRGPSTLQIHLISCQLPLIRMALRVSRAQTDKKRNDCDQLDKYKGENSCRSINKDERHN